MTGWRAKSGLKMTSATKALIQKAKARAEHQDRKSRAPSAVSPLLSPVLVEDMLRQDKWYTFAEIAERYGLSWDKIARDFKDRDGVAKFGSDYRVSDAAVRAWLAEALSKAKRAA